MLLAAWASWFPCPPPGLGGVGLQEVDGVGVVDEVQRRLPPAVGQRHRRAPVHQVARERQRHVPSEPAGRDGRQDLTEQGWYLEKRIFSKRKS